MNEKTNFGYSRDMTSRSVIAFYYQHVSDRTITPPLHVDKFYSQSLASQHCLQTSAYAFLEYSDVGNLLIVFCGSNFKLVILMKEDGDSLSSIVRKRAHPCDDLFKDVVDCLLLSYHRVLMKSVCKTYSLVIF